MKFTLSVSVNFVSLYVTAPSSLSSAILKHKYLIHLTHRLLYLIPNISGGTVLTWNINDLLRTEAVVVYRGTMRQGICAKPDTRP
jgi:hypothetical protein